MTSLVGWARKWARKTERKTGTETETGMERLTETRRRQKQKRRAVDETESTQRLAVTTATDNDKMAKFRGKGMVSYDNEITIRYENGTVTAIEYDINAIK